MEKTKVIRAVSFLVLVFFALAVCGQDTLLGREEASPSPQTYNPNVIQLIDSKISITMSYHWGGVITNLSLLTGNAGNLVSNQDGGYLLQSAVRHVGPQWDQYDTSSLVSNFEPWEGRNYYANPCELDPSFRWNPTQAASETSCGCASDFDSPDDILPTHSDPANPASPVHYRVKFTPWSPFDRLSSLVPSTIHRPNVIEDATVSLIAAHSSNVAVLKHSANYPKPSHYLVADL